MCHGIGVNVDTLFAVIQEPPQFKSHPVFILSATHSSIIFGWRLDRLHVAFFG